jgi:medium-chain acyl-[acyl-carrier-protein] hydrolase
VEAGLRGRQMKLFCFPHAGGGAATFHGWRGALAGVEVTAFSAPGRESRLLEEPHRKLAGLVAEACDWVSPAAGVGYALFGHSFGALIAFEVARELRRRRAQGPDLLVVAACHPPQLRSPGRRPLRAELIRLIEVRARALGVTELDQEVVEIALRPLQADMEASSGYSYRLEPPLECPLLVLGGSEDTEVEAAALSGWRAQTSSECDLELVPGGHFFVETARGAVLGLIGSRLGQRQSVNRP